MTEYAENTVGYHLNRLKEPLRTRALTQMRDGDVPAFNMISAVHNAFEWEKTTEGMAFWAGVHNYFQKQRRKPNNREGVVDGWDMAKECAPDQPSNAGITQEEATQWSNPEFLTNQEIEDIKKYPILAPKRHAPISGGVIDPQAPMKKRIRTIEARHDEEIKELQQQNKDLKAKVDFLIGMYNSKCAFKDLRYPEILEGE